MLLLDTHALIWLATAQKHGMTILTKDRIIPSYPKVKVVWE